MCAFVMANDGERRNALTRYPVKLLLEGMINYVRKSITPV